MRIAILGATSQIARDLIVSFSAEKDKHLYLFARRPDEVTKWLASVGLSARYSVDEFSGFANHEYDAVIANQSLHHVTNLEGLFDAIRHSLHPTGVFVTSDMIGRNGHDRRHGIARAPWMSS